MLTVARTDASYAIRTCGVQNRRNASRRQRRSAERANARRLPPWQRIFNQVRSAKTAILSLAVVGAGIAAGLWMASMTYDCLMCLVALPRYATWQCCVAGVAVSGLAFGVTVALDRAFLRASLVGVRRVSRFLFED